MTPLPLPSPPYPLRVLLPLLPEAQLEEHVLHGLAAVLSKELARTVLGQDHAVPHQPHLDDRELYISQRQNTSVRTV